MLPLCKWPGRGIMGQCSECRAVQCSAVSAVQCSAVSLGTRGRAKGRAAATTAAAGGAGALARRHPGGITEHCTALKTALSGARPLFTIHYLLASVH